MDNLSFEQKVVMLALAKSPKEKADLVTQFSNNQQFFTAFNARRMPLDQYMKLNAKKFAIVAARAKILRDGMKNKGWTDKKYQKYMAELPEELLNERPEFNIHLSRKVLAENIRKFLNLYPQFRVDR